MCEKNIFIAVPQQFVTPFFLNLIIDARRSVVRINSLFLAPKQLSDNDGAAVTIERSDTHIELHTMAVLCDCT